ncbi:hypothetical protein QTG88_09285, partial [Clostridium perfringens]|nr:hypothetical protein [Clostridium perfringens]
LVSLVNLTPLGVLPKNLGISMPSSSKIKNNKEPNLIKINNINKNIILKLIKSIGVILWRFY